MDSPSSAADLAVSLPKGDGAMHGIGESFQPQIFSGTCNYTIPLGFSASRNELAPALALQYSSGHGNCLFGLGWQLAIPSVMRKTEKGLPRYGDDDVFVLSGCEDLVSCGPADAPQLRPPYAVFQYRPRTEGSFARIERWHHETTDETHWRSITRDNVTHLYGASAEARISDPEDASRVYEWLLQESFDAFGNRVVYEYARDATDAAPPTLAEQGRRTTQRYLRRICYGRLPEPMDDAHGNPLSYPDGSAVGLVRGGRRYAFEVVFDYGDWDLPTRWPHPAPLPDGEQEELAAAVPLRPDPFSNYRAGFEIRTLRRCRRVLMFHHFAELGAPTLVQSTEFDYREDTDTQLSFLRAVAVRCHHREGAGTYISAALPSLTFEYSDFRPGEQQYRPIAARGGYLPPTSLNDRDIALVDLSGDGLPDIVQSSSAGMRFWENLGDGVLDRPRFLPQVPSAASLGNAHVAFGDLGGDGRADLLVHSLTLPGFFETTADGAWKRFKPYTTGPSFELGDANVRLLDLTGDGLPDALATRDGHFLWFQCLGERGFAPPQSIARRHELEHFPDVYFNDPSGRVRLAPMCGGLNDIVLVHGDRIDYWPNLGYGRFGRRVTMENAPHLGADFDPRRLFLADLNGTGCADLVYVEHDRVHYWLNRSGNGWSHGRTIDGTPPVTNNTSVRFADVFGSGTPTLLWSYDFASQPDGNYKALDFCGGVKPYVVTEMRNGMGVTTRVSYSSSTRHFLDDQARGTPWITRLPFPVQVLDKVEVIDNISRSKLVTTYRYHHGYFDGREREFRGFARVDQFDTQSFEHFARAEDEFTNAEAAFHSPPVETRCWFHTGVYFDEDSTANVAQGFDYRELTNRLRREFYARDNQAAPVGEHEVDAGGRPQEAYRALRGLALRTEVYGRDGSGQSEHPYSVKEARYRVVQLQQGSGQQHAVYFAHPLEMLDYQYERNPDDPRISHTFTLEVDSFGNSLQSLSIGYGRRQPDANLPGDGDRDKQAQTFVTYVERRYTTALDDPMTSPDDHRAPLEAEVRSYELTGFQPLAGTDRFTLAEWTANDYARIRNAADLRHEQSPDLSAEQKRPIAHTRVLYRRDDLSALLPLGVSESLALPGEGYTLAFPPQLLQHCFGNRVPDSMMADGGYVHLDGDANWWIPSGRRFYSFDEAATPAYELAAARRQFFTVQRMRDAFGQNSFASYDAYFMRRLETKDALGNLSSAQLDYRLLKPFLLTDANGNRTEVRFDLIGLVAGTAIMGKSTSAEGDSMSVFNPDLTPAQLDAFLADPLAHAAELLGTATTRLVYDIDRFGRAGEAPFSATLSREIHASSVPVAPRVQIRFNHWDGAGRIIQSKSLVDPAPRWSASGGTLYNNKGAPVRRYETYFDDSPLFRGLTRTGNSTTIFYDPLGRVLALLHPNHAWEKFVAGPWRQERWDVHDTCLINNPATDPHVGAFFARLPDADFLPTWHGQRVGGALGSDEKEASLKAAVHAHTPTVEHFDSVGRPFLSVTHNRFFREGNSIDEICAQRAFYDVEGNVRIAEDALGRHITRHEFAMHGMQTLERSMESGDRWTLCDAGGQPMLAWNSRDQRIRTLRDALRRPTDALLKEGAGAEKLVSRTVYGEQAPDAAARNLCGRSLQVYDQAGVLTNESYDFKGNPLTSRRQLVRDYRNLLDWSTNPALEDEVFFSATEFDALNRPKTITAPDGSVYRASFDVGSRLTAIDVQLSGAAARTPFITDVRYDADGRQLEVTHGNGARARFEYDAQTSRLTRRALLRGAEKLQDLVYSFDAVGNITRTRDLAAQVLYFDNQVVEAGGSYTYDARYRLIEAEGREHRGQAVQPASSWTDEFRVHLPQPGDGPAMRRYLERYEFDVAGNLLKQIHAAASGNWTREYDYLEQSSLQLGQFHNNRLSSTRDTTAPETYTHDAQGNMLHMPHLVRLDWGFRDELNHVDLSGGGHAYYVYDASRQRVRKVIEKNGGALVEERIYLGAFEVFRRRLNGTVTLERQTLHVLNGQQRVAMVETRTRGNDGSDAQVIRYAHADHLGSVALELDGAAQILSYEEYYPYGATSYQAVRSGLDLPKRYRFTGQERDEETGLQYHSMRYYAPWLGRWISADPIGTRGGANLYAYCSQNPIGLNDCGGTDPNDEAFRKFNAFADTNRDRVISGVELWNALGCQTKIELRAWMDYMGAFGAGGYRMGGDLAAVQRKVWADSMQQQINDAVRAEEQNETTQRYAADGSVYTNREGRAATKREMNKYRDPQRLLNTVKFGAEVLAPEVYFPAMSIYHSAKGEPGQATVDLFFGIVAHYGGPAAGAEESATARGASPAKDPAVFAKKVEAQGGDTVVYAGPVGSTADELPVVARYNGNKVTFDSQTTGDHVQIALEKLERENPGTHVYIGSATHGSPNGSSAMIDKTFKEKSFLAEDLASTAPGNFPDLGPQTVFDLSTKKGAQCYVGAESAAVAAPPGTLFCIGAFCFSTMAKKPP